MKLKGERAHTVNRPELVAKYGYGTKFAMHALRLGFEGVELMTHRPLTLSVAEPSLTTLRAVRSGRIELAGASRLIEHAEERRTLVEARSRAADIAGINRFMVRAHIEHWQSRHLSGAWNENSAIPGLAEPAQ